MGPDNKEHPLEEKQACEMPMQQACEMPMQQACEMPVQEACEMQQQEIFNLPQQFAIPQIEKNTFASQPQASEEQEYEENDVELDEEDWPVQKQSMGNKLESMEVENMKNVYMEQAVNQAEDLQKALQVKRKSAPPRMAMRRQENIRTTIAEEPHESVGGNPLGVRITGWWRWKTVVVPPNTYVVHTRRGHKKPLHVGLGISFRYNPHLDSYLVIPSAMQTIVINANSICKELQGILIQAYVQWITDDMEIAYQRLDFSDTEDPMRVVNLQLREQAEAAIKDKVATMPIREVLSDKQPIIKELTKRLKEVAEGSGDDRGLGIRIVTVQIKEAIVSSTQLWQNLQKPFRASQKTTGRLAEIENESQVAIREREEKTQRETAELETNGEIDKLRAEKQAEAFERKHLESVRRQEMEKQAEQKRLEFEIESEQRLTLLRQQQQFETKKKEVALAMETHKLEESRLESSYELEKKQMEKQWELKKRQAFLENEAKDAALKAQLERERSSNEAKNEQIEKEIEFEEKRRKIANQLSAELVQSKALDMLPKIAQALPHPEQMHSVSIGGDVGSSLPGVTAAILGVLQSYGINLGGKREQEIEEKK